MICSVFLQLHDHDEISPDWTAPRLTVSNMYSYAGVRVEGVLALSNSGARPFRVDLSMTPRGSMTKAAAMDVRSAQAEARPTLASVSCRVEDRLCGRGRPARALPPACAWVVWIVAVHMMNAVSGLPLARPGAAPVEVSHL